MKKKLIKIFSLLFIILIVFVIYYYAKSEKINYVPLGDSLAEGMNPYKEIGYSYNDYVRDYLKSKNHLSYYTKKYTKSSYTTADIIKDLKINSSLKRDLRESDLVTLSIGINDFFNKIDKNNLNIKELLNLKSVVDEVTPNIDNCLKEIRKYAKQDLIIIGYYNPIPFLFNTSGSDLDTLFAYIDSEVSNIAKKYNSKYISLYQLFKTNKDYLPNPSDIHPNTKGYKAISDLIIKNM